MLVIRNKINENTNERRCSLVHLSASLYSIRLVVMWKYIWWLSCFDDYGVLRTSLFFCLLLFSNLRNMSGLYPTVPCLLSAWADRGKKKTATFPVVHTCICWSALWMESHTLISNIPWLLCQKHQPESLTISSKETKQIPPCRFWLVIFTYGVHGARCCTLTNNMEFWNCPMT